MLNVDGRILLADTILINSKIIAPNIGDEVPVRILHEQLDGYSARGRIEVNFGFLVALFVFE